MWFTQVSLRNPVFATMVMLALVVLGLFSFQKLKIDQFPNIDLPVVVITTEYPGASPEIIESEVSKKIEEAVNSTAGISALTSRSYEGLSVVTMCAKKSRMCIRFCALKSKSRAFCGSTRPVARFGHWRSSPRSPACPKASNHPAKWS
jgi:hypothetical protein